MGFMHTSTAPDDPGDIIGRTFMRKAMLTSIAVCTAVLFGADARAQAPAPPAPYGETINNETAKKAAAAAIEESNKNNWQMCVTVVGPSGELIYFERMDNCHFASIGISQHKARAAATFRRATKTFEDRVAQGGAGLTALTLDGMIASDGGFPIIIGGKIVGAIGCSGGTGQQDGQACTAGANAVK
jgi:glc operon protein GlcG